MKMSNYFILFVVSLLFSCTSKVKESGYDIVYKNDKNGKTLLGSKQELIRHIRGGADIKVGWGSQGKNHTIEHLSIPVWIAILDETEVIAHLDPQVLSKTDWENLTASYADSTLLNQEWRVVLTSKGEFDAVWTSKADGSLIKRIPQKHTMTWFVKDGMKNNTPFFRNEGIK
ncbi:MAG: hypothetical protein Mars2KO_07920 [Maribacter sp.]